MLPLLIATCTRVLFGAQPRWIGCRPSHALRIYYANHTSHFDTLALWSALPPRLRGSTRAVAAKDYWGSGPRAWLATRGFNALFIDRSGDPREGDPLAPLDAALHRRESLILFPEGTRRAQALPGAFKSGLFHLATRHPEAELVPVYLDNLWRSMPKGTWLPVPLTCLVRFGTPLMLAEGEEKAGFLERARSHRGVGMTTRETFCWLMGGIAALLVVASTVGWILHVRVARRGGSATIDNLNARIRAWWVMVAVLAACFLLGATATVLLFAAASVFALREFVTLTPTRPGDHMPLVACFYIMLPVQYWLIHDGWYGLFAIFLPVYGFLSLPVLMALSGDTEGFLERVTKLQWGVLITVYCISYAPAVLLLQTHGSVEQRLLLMIYLLIVVQISDVLQYVFGKLFGKHAIAPRVSPSKTVEGLVGGGLSAVAIGTALYPITPFTPLQAAAMSALIVITGFLGGLSLSAAKRSLGAKDWGSMIEGHGGMLDRLDSVSFAAPVFFHVCRYYFF